MNTVFSYWNGIAPGYIYKIFSLRLANTAQIHLADDIGIPPQKTNTGRNYSPK